MTLTGIRSLIESPSLEMIRPFPFPNPVTVWSPISFSTSFAESREKTPILSLCPCASRSGFPHRRNPRLAPRRRYPWGCPLNLYRCSGFRPVRASGIFDAAEVFAKRAARRAFGRRGIVRTLVEDSYATDYSLIEFSAFVGYPSGPNETTGHNVRFTVTKGGSK